MCKICQMRARLQAAGVAPDVIEAVANDAHEIADTLNVAVDVLNNVRERTPDAITAEEFTRVDEALQKITPPMQPGGGLAALLAAVLGGGVSVEVLRVTPKDGETDDDAIKRTLAERESSKATKH